MEENELRDKAKKLYLEGVKQKDIASQLDMSINTLKAWIRRHEWAKDKVAPQSKKSAPKKNKGAPVKKIPKAIESLNDNNKLTEQQKLFCLYYLQSFNATQSYLKAYGCGYNTAMANGSQLLRNAKVKEELTRLKQELQSEQYFNIQDIINEYAKQAFSDIKDVVVFGTETVEMEDGTEREFSFVRLKEDGEVDGTLIQEVKQGKDGVSAKLWDKQKAMDMLVKLLPDDSKGDGQIIFVDSSDEMLKYMEENADEYKNTSK